MSRKRIVATAALLAGAMALTACGGSSSSSGSSGGSSGGGGGQTVKIGFMGDLTGENSGIVIPPKQGAQLAIDEYNATNPKTKVQLVTYDSQADPSQATSLAQKALKDDKIVGLIGPAFSGESKTTDPVLEEGQVPSISPSATNVTLSQNSWKFWHRIVANDAAQGAGAAGYIADGPKAKKVFVIDDNQEYSKGLADVVTSTLTGKSIAVQRDKIDQNGSDYSSTVNKIKADSPDAIFYGGYYAQAGRLLKQLRQAGVTARFLSGDGSLDPGLAKGAGSTNADGAIVACPCLIDPTGTANPASKTFADAYKTKFGSPPSIYSAEGYDAATAFINAIKAGNTDAVKINDFLKTIDVGGVSKQIKFQDNGEPFGGDVYLYEFKGSTYSLLGKASDNPTPK